MRHLPVLFLLTLCLLLPACGDDDPTGPSSSSIDLAGTWRGDLAIEGAVSRMTWTLAQSGGALSGPVLITLPSGVVLLNGTFDGSLNGSVVTYTIAVAAGGIPGQPSCSGQIAGTMTAAANALSMSGTFNVVRSTCPSPLTSGTITLTKG